MKKLSQINEGIFTNGIHRKNQGLEKKEDSVEERLQEFCNRHTFEPHYNYHRRFVDFTITPDKLVNCNKPVMIWDDDLVNGKLPFKFGEVKHNFNCAECQSLTSLKRCPEKVGGSFTCSGCKTLISLEGCPQEVIGSFYCDGCGTQFTEEEVKQRCNVNWKIYV